MVSFPLQVYVNGREWLARRLERHGLCYCKRDNVFLQVSDLARAQHLADGFTTVDFGHPASHEAPAGRRTPLAGWSARLARSPDTRAARGCQLLDELGCGRAVERTGVPPIRMQPSSSTDAGLPAVTAVTAAGRLMADVRRAVPRSTRDAILTEHAGTAAALIEGFTVHGFAAAAAAPPRVPQLAYSDLSERDRALASEAR